MKTQSEIQDRLRGLIILELDRRVAEASRRLPHLCVFNHKHPLDPRKLVGGEENTNFNRIGVVGGPELGLCFYGAENEQTWPGDICEDAIDAQRCPKFASIQSKELLLTQLRQDLSQPDWVTVNLPEVAGLLWVLDQTTPPEVPWWKRLLYMVLRIDIEPVGVALDIDDLLSKI